MNYQIFAGGVHIVGGPEIEKFRIRISQNFEFNMLAGMSDPRLEILRLAQF